MADLQARADEGQDKHGLRSEPETEDEKAKRIAELEADNAALKDVRLILAKACEQTTVEWADVLNGGDARKAIDFAGNVCALALQEVDMSDGLSDQEEIRLAALRQDAAVGRALAPLLVEMFKDNYGKLIDVLDDGTEVCRCCGELDFTEDEGAHPDEYHQEFCLYKRIKAALAAAGLMDNA